MGEIVSYALTNLARVKTRMSITGTGNDTFLQWLINNGTDFIEAQCNRKFKSATYAELHSFTRADNKYIFTKRAPITAVSSIQWRAGLVDDPNYQNIPTTDWITEEDGVAGIIAVQGGWLYEGSNVVLVNYTAGYLIDFDNIDTPANHTLPADITDLCERLVVKMFKRRNAEGKEQESATAPGAGSLKWRDALTEDDKDVINQHRRNPRFR